jgi:hypothetical protein
MLRIDAKQESESAVAICVHLRLSFVFYSRQFVSIRGYFAPDGF